MAWAVYHAGPGGHPEPSLSLPDFGDSRYGFEVPPYATNRAVRIEVVALPPDVRRRISVWAALVVAAARQRHGPWVEVRLEPGEWALVRQRAPWLRKARESFLWLTPRFAEARRASFVIPSLVRRWREAAARPYVVENEQTLQRLGTGWLPEDLPR